MRLFKSREQKDQIEASRSEWDEFVETAVSADPGSVRAALVRLRNSPNSAALSDKERQRRADEAFRRYAENALADDLLNADEEALLGEVGDSLGIPQEDLESRFRDIFLRLVIAKVNDGRFHIFDHPRLIAKRGEDVYLETAAGLIKEVSVREYQGGYGGYSFRVMKGVSYRTGRTRGRSVVVGTQLVMEDSGVLSVTSQRAVYAGGKKTLEFAYPKLVAIEVFSDGIRLSVSNRQKPSLLELEPGMGDVVAATMNAAIQRQ